MVVSPIESRYRTDMNALFEEDARLESWLEVEVALARAHAKLKDIPPEAAEEIASAAKKVKLSRVLEIESEIHHDLMAMVRALTEQCKKYGGYVHYGATSYDIEDTATALTLRRAIRLLQKRLAETEILLRSMRWSRRTPLHSQDSRPARRPHNIRHEVRPLLQGDAAQPGKAGARGKDNNCREDVWRCGHNGDIGAKGMELQELVMKELDLSPAEVTNQVVQRDRHAEVLFSVALVAATLEKIAKEIRNLQRTEIMEVAEPFAAKQVGSSTMPQKRNPHKSERICSLARIVRANVSVAMENIPLEHERDLTNSANERFIFPESFIVTDYMLSEMNKILSGLQFFPENIERNLELAGGLVMAERIMISLTGKGMGRQDAHELMRKSSIEAMRQKRTLLSVLLENKEVTSLIKKDELEKLFNPENYIGKAPQIIEKAVGRP